jgi:hypothetical protein
VPNTPDGKEISSRNAITHGLRAKNTLILPDERQEDFDALAAAWRAEFGVEGQAAEALVRRVILNDWLLQRTERKYLEAETELAATGHMEWTAEQHHKLELFLRYKTTAERSFYRAYNAMHGLRREKIRVELTFENLSKKIDKLAQAAVSKAGDQKEKVEAENKTPAQLLFPGKKSPKKKRTIPILEQWAEVETQDGKTVTTLHPSNDALIAIGQKMLRPPELVYRRLNFPSGVPDEYNWTITDWETKELDPVKKRYGGTAIQRMTVDTWLEVIEEEKEDPAGHIGITGVGNMPRPEEHGGCDCPVCTRNKPVFAKEAAKGSYW